MKPIVYSGRVAVRFSDLDPYGHVNSAHYLDYVISARFQYAQEKLGISGRTLVKQGVGFFLAKAQSKFIQPVVGIQELLVSSWVESIEGPRLSVPYEVKTLQEKLVNSGLLEFVVIDLATNRPTDATDWVRGLFFESGS